MFKNTLKQRLTLEEQNVPDLQFGRSVIAPDNVHIIILCKHTHGMNGFWH